MIQATVCGRAAAGGGQTRTRCLLSLAFATEQRADLAARAAARHEEAGHGRVPHSGARAGDLAPDRPQSLRGALTFGRGALSPRPCPSLPWEAAPAAQASKPNSRAACEPRCMVEAVGWAERNAKSTREAAQINVFLLSGQRGGHVSCTKAGDRGHHCRPVGCRDVSKLDPSRNFGRAQRGPGPRRTAGRCRCGERRPLELVQAPHLGADAH